MEHVRFGMTLEQNHRLRCIGGNIVRLISWDSRRKGGSSLGRTAKSISLEREITFRKLQSPRPEIVISSEERSYSYATRYLHRRPKAKCLCNGIDKLILGT